MQVEEIFISSELNDVDEDQGAEGRECIAVLSQACKPRASSVEAELFDNDSLSLKSRGLMQPVRDFTINAGILDPEPRRLLKTDWQFLALSFGLYFAAGYMIVSGFTQEYMPALLMLIGAAVVTSVLALYRSYDRIVFYSQNGRVPLVVLFNRLPNRDACVEFCDTLAEHIEAAKPECRDLNEVLNDELKVHRRLMEEGVISARRYDIAKQRILGKHT